MKLKGEVEVFKIMQDGTSTSMLKESNMVVDGASEVIVDMLTTPYSLKNVAGSETLNPSNFTVQAVTLGKASQLYGGQPETSAADTNVIGMHAFFNNQNLSDVYASTPGGPDPDNREDDWFGARATQAGVSSFIPSTKLPKEPFPRDVRLEKSSKTQVELYYELSGLAASAGIPETSGLALPFGVEGGWNDASNLIPSKGHNLNALYGLVNKSMESMFQGCYAPSDGIDIYIWKDTATRSAVVGNATPEETLLTTQIQAQTQNVSGRYNTVGSMDKHGYLVAYPLQDHPASGDTTQGVAVSAGTTNSLANVSYTGGGLLDAAGSAAFIASPAVVYNFTISSTDLLALASYKGVTNIGLWAFDQKETYKSESPPIEWNTPTNNRKYKLFAKKVFSEDLTTIQDNAAALLRADGSAGIRNYVDINIQWRMNFDFGETF